jgi:hypothetical protein
MPRAVKAAHWCGKSTDQRRGGEDDQAERNTRGQPKSAPEPTAEQQQATERRAWASASICAALRVGLPASQPPARPGKVEVTAG